MKLTLSAPESALLAACITLLLVACLGPALAHPGHYHQFADQRSWLGIPCALDVLSNLPFAVWGCIGLRTLHCTEQDGVPTAQRHMATLFFAGLILTAAGSSWYHWQPDDAGLALDRLSMVIPFAGLLGLAAAGRISARAGLTLGVATLLWGPISVAVWSQTGNVLPWALVQFGGMALVLWLASRPPLADALPVRWGAVILIYAAAKLLEQGDHQVYQLLGHTLSGHSLKHLIASLAAWPVWCAIRTRQTPGRTTRRP
jgi:hypothetical protein